MMGCALINHIARTCVMGCALIEQIARTCVMMGCALIEQVARTCVIVSWTPAAFALLMSLSSNVCNHPAACFVPVFVWSGPSSYLLVFRHVTTYVSFIPIL
jgi:hypothetical protein